MSQRPLKALGGSVVIAVLLSVGAAVPAQAREAPSRPKVHVLQAKSLKPDHFTSQAAFDLAAGGTANVLSPTLPKDMKSATVTVSTPLSDQDGFKSVALALLREPTPGKKLMACITMARASLSFTAWSAAMQDDLDSFNAVADQLFIARLTYCMQVAQLIANVQAGSAKMAATPCGQVPLGITEKVTKSGGSYTLTKDGPATVKKKNASVTVTCTMVSPTKTVMKIKGKKGKTLRKALRTKRLSLTFGSASDAEAGAHVTVGFKP